MDNTITIFVKICSNPEFRDKIEKMLVDLAQKTRQEPGNVFYRIHRSIEDPNQFMVYERWLNQEALDHHMNTAHLKQFLKASRKYLDSEIAGTVCLELMSTCIDISKDGISSRPPSTLDCRRSLHATR